MECIGIHCSVCMRTLWITWNTNDACFSDLNCMQTLQPIVLIGTDEYYYIVGEGFTYYQDNISIRDCANNEGCTGYLVQNLQSF